MSHKKQRVKYQMEMLSHIAETAINNSSQEVKLQVKFPEKKTTFRL